jgi:hypothetical protein
VGSGLETVDADCRLDATYRLMNDISLVGEWTPLPGVPEFSGEFDGNNRTIANLLVTSGRTETVGGYTFTSGGLFSRIKGASIFALTIEGASIQLEESEDLYVGALSGISNHADDRRTTIEGVTVKQSSLSALSTGDREYGYVAIGGLIGFGASLEVSDTVGEYLEIRGEVKSRNDDSPFASAGGLVGGGLDGAVLTGVSVRESTIQAVADVPSGDAFAGGLVGEGRNSIIEDAVVDTTQVTAAGGTFVVAGGAIPTLLAEERKNAQLINVTVICSDIEAVSSGDNAFAAAGGLVGEVNRMVDTPLVGRFPSPDEYMIQGGRVFGEGSVRASSAGDAMAGGLAGVARGFFKEGVDTGASVPAVFSSGVYRMKVQTTQLGPAQDELHRAGGLVGLLENANADASLVKDTAVSGDYLLAEEPDNLRVGGFVGEVEFGDVYSSYVAGGSVVGSIPGVSPERVGGFVGLVESGDASGRSSRIDQTYVNSTSTPVGGEFFGQSVGARSFFAESIFRDDVNGFSVLPDPYDATVPIGLTQGAMRNFSMYEDPLFWFITDGVPNVEDAWWGISGQINDGFPYLYWEIEESFSILGCSSGCGGSCGPGAVAASGSSNTGALLAATGQSTRPGGGWGIRTPEGFHPTRFPSVRHRPLGESSGCDGTTRAEQHTCHPNDKLLVAPRVALTWLTPPGRKRSKGNWALVGARGVFSLFRLQS